jgi:SAM-dependent methyltransferase
MVNVLPLLWQLSDVWQREGAGGIWLRIRRYVSRRRKPDAFDLAHGTETTFNVDMWDLGVQSPNLRTAVKYQPVNVDVMRVGFESLPPKTRNYPFIDIGCGKGRALIMAHEAGFRRLIGVDFSSELLSVAKKNLAKCKIQAELLHSDADEFKFPEQPCVVYFYNPFGEELTARIARRIPTSSFLVYANPKYRSGAFGNFSTIREGTGLFVGYLSDRVDEETVVGVGAGSGSEKA